MSEVAQTHNGLVPTLSTIFFLLGVELYLCFVYVSLRITFKSTTFSFGHHLVTPYCKGFLFAHDSAFWGGQGEVEIMHK